MVDQFQVCDVCVVVDVDVFVFFWWCEQFVILVGVDVVYGGIGYVCEFVDCVFVVGIWCGFVGCGMSLF